MAERFTSGANVESKHWKPINHVHRKKKQPLKRSGRVHLLCDSTAPVLASQAEAIVDLGRTWPQHRIDIH